MIEPSKRHLEIAQAVFCESPDGHASWITRIARACAQAAAEEREECLEVPAVWSEQERDGMADAFRVAHINHGHYESLFAVATWLLRHRAANRTRADLDRN